MRKAIDYVLAKRLIALEVICDDFAEFFLFKLILLETKFIYSHDRIKGCCKSNKNRLNENIFCSAAVGFTASLHTIVNKATDAHRLIAVTVCFDYRVLILSDTTSQTAFYLFAVN